MPKVSVIIVNYNGKGLIRGCLQTLERQSLGDFEAVIANNASLDGPLYEIHRFLEESSIASIIKLTLNNTPRQIQLYEAMGIPLAFAHLSLIFGQDCARLSKKHDATSITAYQEMGYVPHALVNYVARLGWSYGDQEIFSQKELIERFSLEGAGQSAGIFNPEKLLRFNAHYIKESDPGQIACQFIPFLRQGVIKAELNERLIKVVQSLQPRAKVPMDLKE